MGRIFERERKIEKKRNFIKRRRRKKGRGITVFNKRIPYTTVFLIQTVLAR